MNERGVSKLNPSVIRRIATGQVIFNIAAACKELIENALDAEATSIDIRVGNHGVSSLEIVDNGQGIRETDFDNLARAHYTSKMNDFDELGTLRTFGFRGEALNALSAMGKLTIITRHRDSATGWKLEFDTTGTIAAKTSCARTVGTTVLVERFLEPLPVRRKEFVKNARSEYVKLLNVVQAYCLILKDVRIELTHRSDNGQKKTPVLCVYPNKTLRENICNVFGAEQLKSLMEFVQVAPLQEQLKENGFYDDAALDDFRLNGLVSMIEKGCGRSSADRQFVFINHRPCDFAKVLKVINETYRQYNSKQYPIVILDVQVKGKIDVNVTPDKRQVFVANEDLLLLVIKTSLVNLYEKLLGVCKLGEASSSSLASTSISSSSASINSTSISTISNQPEKASTAGQATESSTTAFSVLDRFKRQYQPAPDDDAPIVSPAKQFRTAKEVIDAELAKSADRRSRSVSTSSDSSKDRPTSDENGYRARRTSEVSTYRSRNRRSNDDEPRLERPHSAQPRSPGRADSRPSFTLDAWLESQERKSSGNSIDRQSVLSIHCPRGRLTLREDEVDDGEDRSSRIRRPSRTSTSSHDSHMDEDSNDSSKTRQTRPPSETKKNESRSSKTRNEKPVKDLPTDNHWSGYRKSTEVPFSVSAMQQYFEEQENREEEEFDVDEDGTTTDFHAKINPAQNREAELELKRCLKKSDFASMQVIGQFNLGFIIARLNDDLFIVDQHASDEKYQFEKLQKSGSFQSQKLLSPYQLEFSPSHEEILREHLDIFKKNGFEFIADGSNSPGKRFMLSAIPSASSCTFDKSDIDEIISVLDDDPHCKMYRPSKMRAILASKACRKAIMIGDSLNMGQMGKILRNLSILEQPWNCPHGRPTVRHLFHTSQIPRNSDDE